MGKIARYWLKFTGRQLASANISQPDRFLVYGLLAAAVLMLATLGNHFFRNPRLPIFYRATGYYQESPAVGMMRIVPIAGSYLVNPCVPVKPDIKLTRER